MRLTQLWQRSVCKRPARSSKAHIKRWQSFGSIVYGCRVSWTLSCAISSSDSPARCHLCLHVEEDYLFVVDVEVEQLFVYLYDSTDWVSSISCDQGYVDAILFDAMKEIRVAV